MLHRTAILAACLALAAPFARAADSPMWGGTVSRNAVNTTEKGIPTDFDVESGKNIKWRAALGSQSYGNPTIAGGKVFVGTNNGAERDPAVKGDKGILMAFEEKDGKFLWQAIHDKLAAGRVNDWPEQGICSTVAAEGGRLWYVSNECQLVCADAEGFLDGENDGPFTTEKYSGKEHADFIWVLDMINELGVFPHNLATSSPLIVGDVVYVVTSNGVDEGHINIPSPRAPSFIAVDKNTGKVIWEQRYPGKNILHGQWSSPSYGVVNGVPQVIYCGGNGRVYALKPEDGSIIWEFDCNPKDSVYILGGRGTRNYIVATPVFDKNRVYISVGQDPEHGLGPGHSYSIDATKTGDITETGAVWHFEKDGDYAWQRTIASTTVSEDRVYLVDLNGFLFCLDRDSGKVNWKYDTLAAVWGSPSVIDGKVIQCDEDGDVFFAEDSKTFKQINEINLGNSVYSTPVAANGALYIANRSELLAIAEGGNTPPAGGGGQ